jgi:hypothetical protein
VLLDEAKLVTVRVPLPEADATTPPPRVSSVPVDAVLSFVGLRSAND